LSVQAKLLLAIELHEVTRLGATRPQKIDVRFVAATNRELARAVADGLFRGDLYYRLNAASITVPPLRDRPSEIEPLALHFVAEVCARFGRPAAALPRATIDALTAHSWPGNIRELRHVIERAVLASDQPSIEPAHLGLPGATGLSARAPEAGRARRPAISDGELGFPVFPDADGHGLRADALRRALRATAGHRGRAAKLLGISRATLYRRLEAYAIGTAEFDLPIVARHPARRSDENG
jgi:DNA-binding NtrC family response regulator